MLAKIKSALICMRSAYCRAWVKLRHGVQLCEGGFIHGLPTIHRCKGSTIELGKGVTLTSCPRSKPPLLSQPVHISTLVAGAKVTMGDYSGISGVRIICCTEVSIGKYSIIGPDTVLYDTSAHDYDEEIGWGGRAQFRGAPIHVGEKCYIGMRCIILKGVRIGDRCIVAAGTLVDRDIPAGHLAKGNPMSFTPLPAHRGGPKAE